jgi:hypothetical protein
MSSHFSSIQFGIRHLQLQIILHILASLNWDQMGLLGILSNKKRRKMKENGKINGFFDTSSGDSFIGNLFLINNQTGKSWPEIGENVTVFPHAAVDPA